MEIRRFFLIIKQWILLILLCVIISGSIGFYLSSQQPPIFQASTKFMIYMNLSNSSSSFDYFNNQSMISTLIELLTSKMVVQQASKELGFQVSSGQASASMVEETGIINLSVTDSNPEEAASIANKLVDVLINQIEQLTSAQYLMVEQNLQNQVDQAEEKMMTIQQQIDSLSDVTVQTNIADVKAQVDDLQLQITDLRNKFSSINPVSATEEEKILMAGYQANLDLLEPILAYYQNLYTNLVVLGQPLQDKDNSFTQLDQLQTSLDLYKQIYINSTSNLETLRMTKAQNYISVIKMEIAEVPSTPIAPKPMTTALLSALVGLMIGASIVFLIEYLDDSIKTPEEVSDLTDLPVIGFVAYIKPPRSKNASEKEKIQVIALTQPRSIVSESFRSLRTNLEFSSVDQPMKIVLVTSLNPSEGKTTIASNLAVVVSSSGKRTLLLDADMRHPSVHRFFNVPNRVGLSDLLRGKLELEDVTTSVPAVPSLTIISSGSLPPNPAELLASNKMNQILADLKLRYDIIIIDSSPMVVSDPQILANRVDGVLYVVRPGKTRGHRAAASIQQLRRVNARLIGVVFNQIKTKQDAYYGNYYYTHNPDKTYQHYFQDTLDPK